MKKNAVPPPTAEQIAARDLERARKSWREATRGRTVQEAIDATNDFLKTHAPRGATISESGQFSGTIYVTTRRAFACEATLDIAFDLVWDADAVVNPDAPTPDRERAFKVAPRIGINWSGTTRSVSGALAALVVYRETVELAAQVEAMLNDTLIYRIEKL